MIEWTEQDSNAAQEQGWDIFVCEGSDSGPWQIQRIDEPEGHEPLFKNDKSAWKFVYLQFLVGDKLANRALQFLSENCMEEFKRIKKYCESGEDEHTLYAVVKIRVKSSLPLEDLIDELGSESYYTIDGTNNIEVLETEWMDTSTQNPI